ncbi:hypothetical protein ACQPZJ_23140 [Actinoplanes sp. CA-054009]
MRGAAVWGRLGRAGVAVLAAVAVGGCGADRSVSGAEETLIGSYLEPLEDAGIGVTVEHACRYAGDLDQPWHLSVGLRLEATAERAADVLKDEDMVVRDDREPMIVQQIFNKPEDGWNGSLAADGDRSVLSLVFSNAERSGWHGTVGWSDSCPPPLGPVE